MALAEAVTGTAPSPGWSRAKLAGFRVLFIYLGLYSVTEMGMLFNQDTISPTDRLWLPVVRLLARALGVRAEMQPDAGSGDTTFNWIEVLLFVILAVAGGIVWSVLSRRREHERLLIGLELWLRYFLFSTMMSYGLVKVIPLQYPPPSPARLLQPYGSSSPMGILWTFMGASGAYTRFGGAAELAGGVLIAFRRTRLVGALVIFGVMTNVFMLNLCYDVCVKLFSFHVVVIAAFLMFLERDRLFALFGAAVPARPVKALTRRMAMLQLIATLFAVGYHSWFTLKMERESRAAGGWSFEGAYRVDKALKNGLELTGGDAWRRVALTSRGLMVFTESDERRAFWLEHGEASLKDPKGGGVLDLRREGERVVVDGKLADSELHVELSRIDPASWLLTSRGFHFISEFPFNR